MADSFKHAAHFAVSSLRNGHLVPTVGAFAAAGFNAAELSHPVVKLYAFEQTFFLFVVQCPQHTDGVFALQSKTRVHQLVGELPGTRQQQQSFGVQIEPANRLPLPLVQLGQTAKNGRSVLRIIVGDNLAGGLVVSDHTGRRRIDPHTHRLTVDLDRVAELNALTNVRRLGVDGNSPFQNELFHFQARTQTSLRQHLVQLRTFRLRRQHAFGQHDRNILFVSVELAGHHIFKMVGSITRCRRRRPMRLR
jgi:hypothetical protein